MERPSPFAFKIEDSRGRETLKPTLDAAVSHLKEVGCLAYYAFYHRPITAYYPDGGTERVDMTPYMESCEPDEETRIRIEKGIDEIIEDNEARWAKLVARTPPGERPCPFSGEFTLFKRDRQMGIERALERHRVRWISQPEDFKPDRTIQ
jgi:hypothetical protein